MDWLSDHTDLAGSVLIGCISPEDRSTVLRGEGLRLGLLSDEMMLVVGDRTAAIDAATQANVDEYLASGGTQGSIEVHHLLEDDDAIYGYAEAIADRAASLSGRVLLDFSSMPKRFFLPLLRTLIEDARVLDVVACYVSAAGYGNEMLVGDPTSGYAIPGFGPDFPEPDTELLIIGAGFMNPGFAGLLEDHYRPGQEVVLLMPYPSDAPFRNRSWQFLNALKATAVGDAVRVEPMPAYDVGFCVERIRTLTGNGARYSAMFPYGPKPVSLSMGLAHLAAPSGSDPAPIYYAQPTWYSPNYSVGVAVVDGVPMSHCYPVKLGGARRF